MYGISQHLCNSTSPVEAWTELNPLVDAASDAMLLPALSTEHFLTLNNAGWQLVAFCRLTAVLGSCCQWRTSDAAAIAAQWLSGGGKQARKRVAALFLELCQYCHLFQFRWLFRTIAPCCQPNEVNRRLSTTLTVLPYCKLNVCLHRVMLALIGTAGSERAAAWLKSLAGSKSRGTSHRRRLVDQLACSAAPVSHNLETDVSCRCPVSLVCDVCARSTLVHSTLLPPS